MPTPNALKNLREISENDFNALVFDTNLNIAANDPTNAVGIQNVSVKGSTNRGTDLGFTVDVNSRYDLINNFADSDTNVPFRSVASESNGKTRYFLVSIIGVNTRTDIYEFVVQETDPQNNNSDWTFVKSRVPVED